MGLPALYAAFDRFPSTKGAGVHIGEWADELVHTFGGGVVVVLGGGSLPAYQREPATDERGPVEVVRFVEPVPNLLDRVEGFQRHLARVLDDHRDDLQLIHVRDPWSAQVVLADPRRRAPLLLEVNGLPSVELPYRYPALGSATIEKLAQLEARCLAGADHVVVPSAVLADRVVRAGADPGSVTVIRNGARVGPMPRRPAGAPARYLAYVGALQPWQGLETALAAFARLADLPDLRLVICTSASPRAARGLQRQARRAGIADRIDWHHRLPHADVAGWLAHAELSLAPLTDSARNVDQGCCPLKVLESMAVATPVVASDLAVVRELVTDGVDGRLVPADRPAELARAVRVLLEYPDEARRLGAAARRRVASASTWDASRAHLRRCYRSLVPAAR